MTFENVMAGKFRRWKLQTWDRMTRLDSQYWEERKILLWKKKKKWESSFMTSKHGAVELAGADADSIETQWLWFDSDSLQKSFSKVQRICSLSHVKKGCRCQVVFMPALFNNTRLLEFVCSNFVRKNSRCWQISNRTEWSRRRKWILPQGIVGTTQLKDAHPALANQGCIGRTGQAIHGVLIFTPLATRGTAAKKIPGAQRL